MLCRHFIPKSPYHTYIWWNLILLYAFRWATWIRPSPTAPLFFPSIYNLLPFSFGHWSFRPPFSLFLPAPRGIGKQHWTTDFFFFLLKRTGISTVDNNSNKKNKKYIFILVFILFLFQVFFFLRFKRHNLGFTCKRITSNSHFWLRNKIMQLEFVFPSYVPDYSLFF